MCSHLAGHLASQPASQPEPAIASQPQPEHVKYIGLRFSQPQPAEAGEPASHPPLRQRLLLASLLNTQSFIQSTIG